MYNLPLPGGSFDAVTIHQVLHFAEKPGEVVREAGRVLRPGGRLVVVDFATHELDSLREEHAHRWLGFDAQDVGAWCESAGLRPHDPILLAGDPLTVGIWYADRPDGIQSRTVN